MSFGQRGPATTASTAPRRGLFRRLLEVVGYTPPVAEERARDRRQPWGKGTGRASYAVVQRRRAANRVARRSRRINRATR